MENILTKAHLGFSNTKERSLTPRGVLYLGQTCNQRCFFCYFHDRINDPKHPEHHFMSIEKAKTICKTLVDVYKNNAIDIQGGEPTIYKHINELVAYCKEIGLAPTLITNALVLDDIEKCKKLKESGVRDLLVSVQGLNEVYDKNVCVPGSSVRQMKAIDNLIEVGIPFRFNTVLNKSTLPQLEDIAKLAIEKNARVVNFIAFNPFGDQLTAKIRNKENVPLYSEAAKYIHPALDMLEEAAIETNVRYYPFCIIDEKHRKSLYNFQQLIYDHHEWDWASFAWTGHSPQRNRDDELTPTLTLQEFNKQIIYDETKGNIAIRAIDQLIERHPKAAGLFHNTFPFIFKNRFDLSLNQQNTIDEEYRLNGKLRAEKHCGYVHAKACKSCSLKNICDGLHGDYAKIFGTKEVNPVQMGTVVDNPVYYIKNQDKIVELD